MRRALDGGVLAVAREPRDGRAPTTGAEPADGEERALNVPVRFVSELRTDHESTPA